MQNVIKYHLATSFAGLALISQTAFATCWEEAAKIYGIPVSVLQAVAKTESNFDADAKHINANGTTDFGLMQINSAWLPKLGQYGVTRESLKDACTNLKVGAWIISNNAKKMGWNWNAIGAYNVGCAKLDSSECERRRNKYAWKIHAALNQFGDIGNKPSHEMQTKTKPQKIVSIGGTAKTGGLSYADAATEVSRKLIEVQKPTRHSGKIMVVTLDIAKHEAQEGAPATIQMAYLDQHDKFMSVGDFLNYKDQSSHE